MKFKSWDEIYRSKDESDCSWFEAVPENSLSLIKTLALNNCAEIIDVGSGNSRLAEELLKAGFTNLTVLDISATAILKARQRLKLQAEKINWLIEDFIRFRSNLMFDVWHDRAVFHFFTDEGEILKYLQKLNMNLRVGGYVVVSTFSNDGPAMCSGLPVLRYSPSELVNRFSNDFETISCYTAKHVTPWNTGQEFTHGLFKKIK